VDKRLITGVCFECCKPCTEADLTWSLYWCDDCLKKSFIKYEKGCQDA